MKIETTVSTSIWNDSRPFKIPVRLVLKNGIKMWETDYIQLCIYPPNHSSSSLGYRNIILEDAEDTLIYFEYKEGDIDLVLGAKNED